MRLLNRRNLIILGIAFVSSFCSSGSDTEPTSEDDEIENKETDKTCDKGMVLVDEECVTPSVPDLAPGWTRIEPGGDTICSKGTPYSFFVRPGTVNKLFLFFGYGGFCFNASLCKDGALNLVAEVRIDEAQLAKGEGVFDLDNPDNPFKDWYMVYVPDCTGDFSWGDNVIDYPAMGADPAITIRHKGFVNASTATDWVFENFDGPEQIVMSGVSGGADAALAHGAFIQKRYQGSRNIYLADASAGVTTDEFIAENLPNWNPFVNIPEWIPALSDAAKDGIIDWDMMLIEGAKYFPDSMFVEFESAHDPLQAVTLQLMGGNKDDWPEEMEDHLKNVSESIPDNFRYFVVAGGVHVMLDTDKFYRHQVDGTRFVDWLTKIIDGEDVPNMHCTECETEVLAP
jgi:hypothetical protein